MSDPTLCHYSALGLTKEATLSDIKKAFRKLALEFHPDKVQGEQAKEANSKKFQRVNEAYGILSDQDKRQEYDDRTKLAELRRRAKGEANISVPRTPTSTQHYDVRYAEPRPDTFSRAKSTSRTAPPPSTSSKFYPQYPPSASRSYEEDIYTRYEDLPRTARRQPSYNDEKPSKREEERERERRQEARAAERAAERAAAERTKEKERRVDKDSKKAKEKLRRREGEEKRSHREYHDDDDGLRTSKLDKKKSSSSSKKHDDRDKREKSIPREVETILPEKSARAEARAMMAAADYINASRSKVANPPPLSRSSTFQEYQRYANPPVAVPTPPVAQEAPFPPPNISVELDSDEDQPRRSAAKPSTRRSSETPKTRERERSSHKKSGSGSREYVDTPPVVIPSHPRLVPQFSKGSSTPPKVPDSPPRSQKLPRSQTMRETEYSRVVPPPQPQLNRSSTYHYGEYDNQPRGRDRSRYQTQILSEEDSDSDDRRFESSRRDRRHRTHSPEFVDYAAPPPLPRTGSTRYTINKDGRTAEPVYYYPDGASPPSRKAAKGATYYEPYGRAPETRPPMPPRSGSTYSSTGGYVPHKIKTAQSYTRDDIQYSQMAYQQEAAYGC